MTPKDRELILRRLRALGCDCTPRMVLLPACPCGVPHVEVEHEERCQRVRPRWGVAWGIA